MTTYEARVWAMPAEPGPEVLAVRDADGYLWHRNPDGSWQGADDDPGPVGTDWPEVLAGFGPLTDATPEVQP